MSLATRCTACGTIFRVVQDQLRVSEGWVRCGRCAEVFDAREQLFDMDREAPPPWPVPSAAASQQMAPEDGATEIEPVPAASGEAPPEPLDSGLGPLVEAPPDESGAPDDAIDIDTGVSVEDFRIDEPPAGMRAPRHEPVWQDEPAEPEPFDAEPAAHAPITEDQPAAALAAAPVDAQMQPADAPAARPDPADIGFLSAAAGAARWQRPGVRLGLAGASLLLLLTLSGQTVWHFRDALAAIYPQSAPALQSMCRALGCELQPWRRIDALSVDNSSLTQVGSGGSHYKLAIQLRNKANYALALPWVDVSLTDASGALVSRRMLRPEDFAPGRPAIEARSEQALQIVFTTEPHKVSGYSVEIFQP